MAPVADTLVLNVCEDAYKGDAQFTVAVDGVGTGQVYTVTASHYGKQSQDVSVQGFWGAGPHAVTVTYTNDLADEPGRRNLYVNYASYDGGLVPVHAGLFWTGAVAGFTVRPAGAVPGLRLLGVNLAGAEFGVDRQEFGGVHVGALGVDYIFPTAAELEGYAAEGANVVRLPFSWERLQPVMGGGLDPAYLAGLDGVVRHAGRLGVRVILDPHNYGYGYGALVGSGAVPAGALADLWRRLAAHYAGSAHVMFGLMNEPWQQSPAEWLAVVNPVIAAIRGTGAGNEILVPGTHHANGDSWVSDGNAAMAEQVVDPADNVAFEVHQYNDWDESGGDASVVSATIGVDRLVDATAWAEATGHRLFLGEFGAGRDAASLAALGNQLAFMQAHSGAWQGGTLWGGGPWWPPDYAFATDPVDGVASPQMAVLLRYGPVSR